MKRILEGSVSRATGASGFKSDAKFSNEIYGFPRGFREAVSRVTGESGFKLDSLFSNEVYGFLRFPRR